MRIAGVPILHYSGHSRFGSDQEAYMHTTRLLSTASILLFTSVLAACAGSDGAKGDKGDPGAPGDPGAKGDPGNGTPSLSALVPGHAFLERSVDVTIAGNGTTWADGVKVDFGPGITVDNVVVASPTAIVASVTIAVDAAVGKRDIKVGDLVYKGAFDVESPLKLTTSGDVAQGSIFAVSAKELDVSTPFDTTTQGDGLFTPITYPNLAISGATGIAGEAQNVSLFSVDALVLTDVTIPAADALFSIESGPLGDVTKSSSTLTVAARTPEAFDLASPPSATLTAFGSKLYQITPPSGANFIDITPTGANQVFALLPQSGKWSEALTGISQGKQTLVADTTNPVYLITLSTQAGDVGFTVATNPAPTKESEPNDTSGMATALGTLPSSRWGQLPTTSDVDWYSFTAAPGDVGKTVHVVTHAPDPKTDTLVEVFASDGTTSLGGPSDDQGYHEDWTSTAIPAAGTIFVKVSYSTFGYTQSNYVVDVSLN
jgi:hypothetical protein